jgi:hypothetical protein
VIRFFFIQGRIGCWEVELLLRADVHCRLNIKCQKCNKKKKKQRKRKKKKTKQKKKKEKKQAGNALHPLPLSYMHAVQAYSSLLCFALSSLSALSSRDGG